MNDKFKKIVAVLATLAVLAGGWYFFYWLKSPQHSVALIADAVRQHDLKTFEKHVDMDTLYGHAYDDVVAVTFGADKDANPIIVAIVKGIKNLAVPLLENETRSYIMHGDKPENEAEVHKQVASGNESGAEIVDNLKDRTGFGALKFDGVESSDVDGETATVGIKLHDESLSRDFILKIKMHQLDNGLWRLLQITNLQDFMQQREAAVKDKLAELNKPIAEQIAQNVQLDKNLLQITSVHYSAIIRMLESEVTLTNTSGKNINYIAGVLELYGDDGQIFYSGNFASNSVLQNGSNKLYKFDFELNPYVNEDAQVINSDLSKIKWNAYLTNVAFDDGTSLDYLTALPEK